MNRELRPYELDGTAVVDFDQVFPGEWTELLLVCDGASQADLKGVLGYTWADSPNLGARGFFSLAIFSDSERVVDHYSFGQNDLLEDFYVTTCPSFMLETPDAQPTPGADGFDIVLIEREFSEVEFTYSPSTPGNHWFVSDAEFNRLRNRG